MTKRGIFLKIQHIYNLTKVNLPNLIHYRVEQQLEHVEQLAGKSSILILD